MNGTDMSLSDQDREWVRSIVEAAIMQMTTALKSYTHNALTEHVVECPNISRMKWFVIGMLIAGGSSVVSALGGSLVKLLTK